METIFHRWYFFERGNCMKICQIFAFEILDSRGNPTVEAHVITESGYKGYGKVPSGASTGMYEAVEIRDKDSRFNGKGVQHAVFTIENKIAPALLGIDVREQMQIDDIMKRLDGTENKVNLGANAMLAVSIACLRAAANAYGMEVFQYIGGFRTDLMPLPMMNIINGGVHAQNSLDVQEFMIVPVGAEKISEAVRMCAEIYHALKNRLQKYGFSTNVGDEGGFAPDFEDTETALDYILDAIKDSGYKSGEEVKIALDAAASEWYQGGVYHLPKANEILESESLIRYWRDLLQKYPIISIEDPADENDWETWEKITRIGKTQIVGDDLFVTQENRLVQGIEKKAANAILIKPNQVGTITETINTIKLAKQNGFGTIISHRSGDTEDSFIADLAVGMGAGQIKTGAPCRSERTSKYNRLLYIEKAFNGLK